MNNYRIPYSNIKYIRRGGRQLSIETLASVSIFDNRGVKEFLEALNDSRFVLIDRGCILNVDFAKQITGTEVILTTNERLAISPSHAQKFEVSSHQRVEYLAAKNRKEAQLCFFIPSWNYLHPL